MGSPYYLSPEVCSGVGYNAKSDVWVRSCACARWVFLTPTPQSILSHQALGCVLFELCTLNKAFHGSNLLSVVNKICNGAYEVVEWRALLPHCISGATFTTLPPNPLASRCLHTSRQPCRPW